MSSLFARMFNRQKLSNTINNLDKRLGIFTNFIRNYGTVIFSFSLGLISSFLYRDEYNLPTCIQIKQAYLTHEARLNRTPNEDILKIIDPTIYGDLN